MTCNKKRNSTVLTVRKLQPFHKVILKLLHENIPACLIAKKLRKDPSVISKHIKRLKTARFISEETRDKIKLYALTKKGVDTVAYSFGPYEKRLKDRAHAIMFKSKIERKPRSKDSLNSWRVIEMRNWSGFRKKFFGVAVLLTPGSVVFEFPAQYYKSSFEALASCKNLVVEIIAELEKELPGLVVGKPSLLSEVVRQEHALQNDEFAKYCKEREVSFNDGRIAFDASKNDIPELEFVDRRHAADDWDIYRDFVEDVITDKFNHKTVQERLARLLQGVERMAEAQERIATSQEVNAKQLGVLLRSLAPPSSQNMKKAGPPPESRPAWVYG